MVPNTRMQVMNARGSLLRQLDNALRILQDECSDLSNPSFAQLAAIRSRALDVAFCAQSLSDFKSID